MIELIDHMGDDLRIVNAARVSYAKRSESLSASDTGLISYLMKNRHGTPFEMVYFTFRIYVPIGVAREWMRHRIGSFNEVSTRYVEMDNKFYIPKHASVRRQVGKAGHYTFETMSGEEAQEAIIKMANSYDASYNVYKELLELGVAKELARNVLPLGLMTQFYWSVNLRSLLNFLSLRTHQTALLEIREEAEAIEREVEKIVPVSIEAWRNNGKIAP